MGNLGSCEWRNRRGFLDLDLDLDVGVGRRS